MLKLTFTLGKSPSLAAIQIFAPEAPTSGALTISGNVGIHW
jgi:hypothetical protein